MRSGRRKGNSPVFAYVREAPNFAKRLPFVFRLSRNIAAQHDGAYGRAARSGMTGWHRITRPQCGYSYRPKAAHDTDTCTALHCGTSSASSGSSLVPPVLHATELQGHLLHSKRGDRASLCHCCRLRGTKWPALRVTKSNALHAPHKACAQRGTIYTTEVTVSTSLLSAQLAGASLNNLPYRLCQLIWPNTDRANMLIFGLCYHLAKHSMHVGCAAMPVRRGLNSCYQMHSCGCSGGVWGKLWSLWVGSHKWYNAN